MGPPSVLVEPLLLAASPQAMVHVQGASVAPPGSVNVALSENAVPSETEASDPAFTAGATLAIVTAAVAGALASPSASVTTRVAVYVPFVAYVFAGLTPVPVVPSPKVQAYVRGKLLSGSLEPAPLNVTLASAAYGPPAFAVGAWLGGGGPPGRPWQLPDPASTNEPPGTGMNCHE